MKSSKKKTKKRNPRKTWENKLDDIFSKVVRKRGYCERCMKIDYSKLQCSHIHSRTKMSVRWDLDNAFCLCSGCHLYWWHVHPIDSAEFTKDKLGNLKYMNLNAKALGIKKWTIEEMQELHKELIKLYEQST